MEWLLVLEKGFWYGLAALGFAILFNVPARTLFTIWLLAAVGGIAKLLLVKAGANPIMATLGGSGLIGILSIEAAHFQHSPPLVFSIPSVIPMAPGVLAYRTMLGLIYLTGNPATERYSRVLAESVSNGVNAFFILLCLAVGGSLPFLITREESAKKLKSIGKERSGKTG
jgi:uncharacterized membrane protein YjjB (DUF3815 family)